MYGQPREREYQKGQLLWARMVGMGKYMAAWSQEGDCHVHHEGFIIGIMQDMRSKQGDLFWRQRGRKTVWDFKHGRDLWKWSAPYFLLTYGLLSQYFVTACLFQNPWLFPPCSVAQPFPSMAITFFLDSKVGSIFDVCLQLQHQLKICWSKSPWGCSPQCIFLDPGLE